MLATIKKLNQTRIAGRASRTRTSAPPAPRPSRSAAASSARTSSTSQPSSSNGRARMCEVYEGRLEGAAAAAPASAPGHAVARADPRASLRSVGPWRYFRSTEFYTQPVHERPSGMFRNPETPRGCMYVCMRSLQSPCQSPLRYVSTAVLLVVVSAFSFTADPGAGTADSSQYRKD